jgi:transcriptional regulator with XRE-family HTH domain
MTSISVGSAGSPAEQEAHVDATHEQVSGDNALDGSFVALGEAIRQRRQGRGLTLNQVAGLSGLSQPFLSQVERGLARPSLRSIGRIATALGTSSIGLLAIGKGDNATDVMRAEDRDALHQSEANPGAQVLPLVRGDRQMRAVEFTGHVSQWEGYFLHRNDEFMYVIEGGIEVDLDGEVTELTAGDTVYYSGGVAHRWRTAGEAPSRVMVVIVNEDVEVVGPSQR